MGPEGVCRLKELRVSLELRRIFDFATLTSAFAPRGSYGCQTGAIGRNWEDFVNLTETLLQPGNGSPLGMLATPISLGMAALVTWAGAEKVRDLNPTAKVIFHLGVPSRATRPAALLLALAEIGVAVGLVQNPGSYLVAVAVMGLAVLFAVAGGMALRSGKRIACSCFGSMRTGYLGRAQILALPAWICAGLILLAAAPPARAAGETTVVLALIATGMALARVPGALRALLEARSDRRAATEIYQWLQ